MSVAGPVVARRLLVQGRVQGVGFRPFVARRATTQGLTGWVRNTPRGVELHLQGLSEAIAAFCRVLKEESPRAAVLQRVEVAEAEVQADVGAFRILPSLEVGEATPPSVEITPDLAACPACLAEFDDPADRRHGYALDACTDCGPRFTIQHAPPFDRERTSMARFAMCPDCRREYDDPADRRFHAQNTACPRCGPRVWIEEDGVADATSQPHAPGPSTDRAAIERAAMLVRSGRIVAVQGLGGFHLLCDATDEAAVLRLRERKQRPRKPLAVLLADPELAGRYAELDPDARAALEDPAAPIVLVRRRDGTALARAIAPGLESVGVLRAYTPLHRALVQAVGRPVVATSANASDEPMPIDAATARAELAGTADAFLLHDRPIVRPADDSVVRTIGGRAVPLRVGRGLAPVRIPVPFELPPLLATGGHLKAAVALSRGREIWLGPHIGDLGTPAVRRRYRDVADDLGRLLGVEPRAIACDLHPDYFTTAFARESGLRVVAVQHHHAHVAACLAEHDWAGGPVLGISWDGTGYGTDGGLWGGEFLLVNGPYSTRVGSLWPFPLVGGDRAAREPRRAAAGVAFAAGEPVDAAAFTPAELRHLDAALRSSRLPAVCTSAGRLFDAWAALLGLCQQSAYEGEAAIRLEEAADPAETGAFPVEIVDDDHSGESLLRLDWRPWVAETRAALARGESPGTLAARFHNALASGSLEMARRIGVETVVLTGGCFQNRRLSETVEQRLADAGFEVLMHQTVPPGDGGLAVGQLWVAAQLLRHG